MRAFILTCLLLSASSAAAQNYTGQTVPPQFKVVPVGDTAILVDGYSGKTWQLVSGKGGERVWKPIKKVEGTAVSPREALRREISNLEKLVILGLVKGDELVATKDKLKLAKSRLKELDSTERKSAEREALEREINAHKEALQGDLTADQRTDTENRLRILEQKVSGPVTARKIHERLLEIKKELMDVQTPEDQDKLEKEKEEAFRKLKELQSDDNIQEYKYSY